MFISSCRLTRANPVHLQPAIVDLSELLNKRLSGNVHGGVEQKLALISAFNVKLDHDDERDNLERTANQQL